MSDDFHSIKVRPIAGGFRAECTCEWQASIRDRYEEARDDRDGHWTKVQKQREESAAEAAYEHEMERFYGGGEPVTMDEMHRAAWEEKRRLR